MSEKSTWKVFPDDVVTVDNKGNVKAIGVGAAQVSVVYLHDDPSLPQEYRDHEVEYTCKVTVTGEIHLDHTKLKFTSHSSKQLQLLDENGNPITSGVTWSVDSTKMFEIDQTGLITCNGPTTKVIKNTLTGYTATATYQGVQYTCELVWYRVVEVTDEVYDHTGKPSENGAKMSSP